MPFPASTSPAPGAAAAGLDQPCADGHALCLCHSMQTLLLVQIVKVSRKDRDGHVTASSSCAAAGGHVTASGRRAVAVSPQQRVVVASQWV